MINHPNKIKNLIKKSNQRINKITSNNPDKKILRLLNFIRQGVKLGYNLAGKDIQDFDNKTLRLISPRFLSVVPENIDNDTVKFLFNKKKFIYLFYF